MSPATLQKLRDPNYRIKQQNELGPDMPDTMMMGPYQRERQREKGRRPLPVWKRGSNWVKYAQDDSINNARGEQRVRTEWKELNVVFCCGKAYAENAIKCNWKTWKEPSPIKVYK